MGLIKKCNCKHEDQDILHGKGMRVHNKDSKGNDRCTVCGTTTRNETKGK